VNEVDSSDNEKLEVDKISPYKPNVKKQLSDWSAEAYPDKSPIGRLADMTECGIIATSSFLSLFFDGDSSN
jgi:hypothetical protein